MAGQLGVADPSGLKRYTEREKTQFDHQWEIRQERGYREFAEAEEEFSGWVAARSRAAGDGPKAIFADELVRLLERKVLLPGVTTLARLVASVRDETTRQMWEELAALPDPVQRRALDRLPEVPHGARVSDLERWRNRCSGAAAAAGRAGPVRDDRVRLADPAPPRGPPDGNAPSHGAAPGSQIGRRRAGDARPADVSRAAEQGETGV